MSEQVWIVTSPRTRKVYHTQSDCSRLIDSKRPTNVKYLTDEWRECSYCAGTAGSGGGPNEMYRKALEQ